MQSLQKKAKRGKMTQSRVVKSSFVHWALLGLRSVIPVPLIREVQIQAHFWWWWWGDKLTTYECQEFFVPVETLNKESVVLCGEYISILYWLVWAVF